MKSLSRGRLFATPWTIAYNPPLSMGFSMQEYWSGLTFLSPGDLPNPRMKPRSPALQADTFPSELSGKPLFHAKMGSIKDRTEAEDIKKRWQEYTEELYKKDLNDPDNHDGVITHLEPDILECASSGP